MTNADAAVNLLKEDLDAKMKEYTMNAYGPTLSIDCACTADSLGTLIQVTEVTNFGITSKELDIRGSRLQNRKFQTATDLIREGKLNLDHKISHTFPFLDAQKAFDFNDTQDLPSAKSC